MFTVTLELEGINQAHTAPHEVGEIINSDIPHNVCILSRRVLGIKPRSAVTAQKILAPLSSMCHYTVSPSPGL